MTKKSIFSVLQKIGRSLMLPVSVLPAAGIMLRLGQDDLLGQFGIGFQFLSVAGNAIFNNLPLIFAVGVAIGFSGGKAVAALSSMLGELILEEVFLKQSSIIGTTLDMGVFGGIIIGIMSAILYKKFHSIKLPRVLGFFSGKRFVPIVTSIFAFIFAIIALKIWLPIQRGISFFATWASHSALGPAFYAAGKRALIPMGIHHIYYQPFLFQFGEYITEGVKYFGDSPRFFHGDPTAGIFMAAEYPIIMFGLPGAALATILSSKKEKRTKVCTIMFSAALVSFLTGITEPIEFTFIFVAPILYVFHIAAAFLSGIITSLFNIRLGYTFSASFIDYILGYPYAGNPLLLWIVGPLFFILYFLVFYFTIRLKNIDIFQENQNNYTKYNVDSSMNNENNPEYTIAELFIKAAGGIKNIQDIDACVTRIRLTVIDSYKVDRNTMKELGAAGIFEAVNSFQVVMGTEAERIVESINQIMSKELLTPKTAINYDLPKKYNKEIYNSKTGNLEEVLEIFNPIDGKIIALKDVRDEVFSKKLLGDGFAIIPKANIVYSPVKGVVSTFFPTKHAIVIKSDNGYEVMIHVGIDTVKLNGEGFTSFVKQGDRVDKGQILLNFNKTDIEKDYDITTPVIVTNLENNFKIYTKLGEKKKEDIISLIIKE